jgi:hypothetical protein
LELTPRYSDLTVAGDAVRNALRAGTAVFLVLFAWLVWPTPYRYDHETIRSGQYARTVPIRINRLSGVTEVFGTNGWYRPSSTPLFLIIPPDELSKIIAKASFDSGSNALTGSVYNGSQWTVTDLTFRIVVKRTDESVIWDHEFKSDPLDVAPLSTSGFRVTIGEALAVPSLFEIFDSETVTADMSRSAPSPWGTWKIVSGGGFQSAR